MATQTLRSVADTVLADAGVNQPSGISRDDLLSYSKVGPLDPVFQSKEQSLWVPKGQQKFRNYYESWTDVSAREATVDWGRQITFDLASSAETLIRKVQLIFTLANVQGSGATNPDELVWKSYIGEWLCGGEDGYTLKYANNIVKRVSADAHHVMRRMSASPYDTEDDAYRYNVGAVPSLDRAQGTSTYIVDLWLPQDIYTGSLPLDLRLSLTIPAYNTCVRNLTAAEGNTVGIRNSFVLPTTTPVVTCHARVCHVEVEAAERAGYAKLASIEQGMIRGILQASLDYESHENITVTDSATIANVVVAAGTVNTGTPQRLYNFKSPSVAVFAGLRWSSDLTEIATRTNADSALADLAGVHACPERFAFMPIERAWLTENGRKLFPDMTFGYNENYIKPVKLGLAPNSDFIMALPFSQNPFHHLAATGHHSFINQSNPQFHFQFHTKPAGLHSFSSTTDYAFSDPWWRIYGAGGGTTPMVNAGDPATFVTNINSGGSVNKRLDIWSLVYQHVRTFKGDFRSLYR